MLCPGCHLEIMVPAGALTRWELTASESVHSMGMTWEVCDKTQPGNWSKTIQDHKTPFFQMLCASKWHNITFLIMHATPWSMCELTLKPWKQQFECTFCLWGFLLWFLLLLLWMGRDRFCTLSGSNCRGVFLLNLFLLALFFSSKRCSCLWPQKWSRSRLSAQNSSRTGAPGSSEDTGMSSGLGNCPLRLLNLL